MRLAVLSDIHGNLEAFEAVLADLKALGGADLTWCLGDLAAFGPRPHECIRRVRELAGQDEGRTFRVIGGNTDRYLVTGERFPTPPASDEETFKTLAASWQGRDSTLNWNLDQLDFEDYEYLKKLGGLELHHTVAGYGHLVGFHAVPGDDEAMLLPDTPDEEARDYLLDREGRLGIGGHTHRQMDRDLGRWRVVNVGSVGMPLDVRGLASWGLFTFGEEGRLTVELRRVPFDVEAVIGDLQTIGHPAPEWLAARLLP